MKSKLASLLTKYLSCALFVWLLVWAYLSLRELPQTINAEYYLMLCDAFTIPGMLLILVGGLVWASNLGALNGLAYVVTLAVRSLIPGKRIDRDKTYSEYVEMKEEKRVRGYGFLFISGGVTMAIALVFMALYYQV